MSIHDFWTPFSLYPFLNALFIGISLASIFFIAALGLTIIYGAMGVINMAHGEFIMLGAYTTYVFQQFLGVPFLLCLPLAFIVLALIGWAIERGIIRTLYQRPLDTLLATWGLSLILIQGIRLIFGGQPKYVAVPKFLDFQIEANFIHLSGVRLFIIIFAIVIGAVTWFLMYKTNLGVRIRAVMQDKEMAASFGIDANKIYSITFAYGAGLAAIFSYFTNETFSRFILFTLIVVFLRFRPQGLITEGATRR